MKKLFPLFFFAAMIMAGCNPGGDDHDNLSVTINGVQWATRNVGAPGEFSDKPEDFGMFYQWGKNVGWSATDPLVSSNGDTTWDDSVVSGTVWEPSYDPCPDGWRVPSLEDFQALCDDTKVVSTWTRQGGVDGRLFVDATTEKSIFLPAAGYRYMYGSVSYQGIRGGYWSSSTHNSRTGVYALLFNDASVYTADDDVYAYGFAVRCVRQ